MRPVAPHQHRSQQVELPAPGLGPTATTRDDVRLPPTPAGPQPTTPASPLMGSVSHSHTQPARGHVQANSPHSGPRAQHMGAPAPQENQPCMYLLGGAQHHPGYPGPHLMRPHLQPQMVAAGWASNGRLTPIQISNSSSSRGRALTVRVSRGGGSPASVASSGHASASFGPSVYASHSGQKSSASGHVEGYPAGAAGFYYCSSVHRSNVSQGSSLHLAGGYSSRRRSAVVIDAAGRPLAATPYDGAGWGGGAWWDAWEETQQLLPVHGSGAVTVGSGAVASATAGSAAVGGVVSTAVAMQCPQGEAEGGGGSGGFTRERQAGVSRPSVLIRLSLDH